MSEVHCIDLSGQGQVGDLVRFLFRHHRNQCSRFADEIRFLNFLCRSCK